MTTHLLPIPERMSIWKRINSNLALITAIVTSLTAVFTVVFQYQQLEISKDALNTKVIEVSTLAEKIEAQQQIITEQQKALSEAQKSIASEVNEREELDSVILGNYRKSNEEIFFLNSNFNNVIFGKVISHAQIQNLILTMLPALTSEDELRKSARDILGHNENNIKVLRVAKEYMEKYSTNYRMYQKKLTQVSLRKLKRKAYILETQKISSEFDKIWTKLDKELNAKISEINTSIKQ